MRSYLRALPAMLAVFALGAAPAQAAGLRAGVGKADITPQTGYYLGGWTRADRTAQGQHTRLFSRAMVLERGGRKIALVQVDLFMVPGGMVRHIGQALAARGFSERNILISVSHTHSGPGGYANFPTLNQAAPSKETVTDPFTFTRLISPSPADRQLYAFLTRRITTAIRRADEDRGPAMAGWGSAEIFGLTRNRSLEAHLGNHGFDGLPYGTGRISQDPGGYRHTVDPAVNVLRVDKVVRRRGRRRRVPVGGWSTFANHGTVTKATFGFYNADHHGSAMQVFERRVRRAGKTPRRQEVLNVYGNSNEGDMSAGLDRHGPAASDYVGRVEAAAMLRAWRAARRQLSRTPALSSRWTRICFCGQDAGGRPVASRSQVGLPFLTGSEENRGPVFDITRDNLEGRRAPTDSGPHGRKLFLPGASNLPRAAPLMTVRVGRRLIVSVPGEGTKEVGARIRAAVGSAVAGSGIERVVVSGLANEFVHYFTTPEEYDQQHYEGAATQFGRQSSVLITNELAKLAGTLVRRQPAPAPFDFDPTNGVSPDGPPYPAGAASARALAQPAPRVARLARATFSWQGGPKGLDRPVDRAFVTAQRRRGRRWRSVTSDLGLGMLWSVTADGRYTVRWEVPLGAKRGTYRLVVTGKRYRVVSRPFLVGGAGRMRVVRVPAASGRVAVGLRYPEAVRDVDLTWRPSYAIGGTVRFRVGSRTVKVKRRRARFFSVRAPAGVPVTVPTLAAKDRFGNANSQGVRLR